MKHLLSPCALDGDSVPAAEFSFQVRAQAYKVCTAIANTATFSLALCIQAQLFAEKAKDPMHAAVLSHTREHLGRFARRELK